MERLWSECVGRQYQAVLDMLEQAIDLCPEPLWRVPLWEERFLDPGLAEFWYLVFHTLFWLDLYLSGAVEGFTPPAPFSLDELDPAGLMPERQYTKAELKAYLNHTREKCRVVSAGLTEQKARQICKLPLGEIYYAELLLDNLRHVQEHTAQLNLFLGQQKTQAAVWVSQPKGS